MGDSDHSRMDELRELAYSDILDLVEPDEMFAFLRLYRAALCVARSNRHDIPYRRLDKLQDAVNAFAEFERQWSST